MQGNLSFSYLFPLAHNELPFPSFHISFTSSRIGIPFLTLIQFSFPSQPLLHPINFPPSTFPLPLSLLEPKGSSRVVHRATYCGVVALVQLHPLSSSHPQKVSPPLGAGAAGQPKEPLPFSLPGTGLLPRNSCAARPTFSNFSSGFPRPAPSTIFWFCLAAPPPLRW